MTEIGPAIGITPFTAKIYTSNLYKKLGAKNGRVELMQREIAKLRERIEKFRGCQCCDPVIDSLIGGALGALQNQDKDLMKRGPQ